MASQAPLSDSRQQKAIFMNGGGGHEESVTWVLAEAERGMLVHCCCFVVNLVRGYTAAGRFTPTVSSYSAACFGKPTPDTFLRITVHRYPRPQRWACVSFFLFFFFFFFKCGKMFWHPFVNCSSCHGDILAHADGIVWVTRGRQLGWVSDPRYESWCWLCRLFQWRGHVLC